MFHGTNIFVDSSDSLIETLQFVYLDVFLKQLSVLGNLWECIPYMAVIYSLLMYEKKLYSQ